MALTYTTYVAALANLTATDSDDANFVAILPDAIDYAEQRIYRELDLLSTVTRDSSATLTVGIRSFTLPTSLGRFVTTQGINVITPSTTTTPDGGTRNPLTPVSRDTMDVLWPGVSGAATPTKYAMVTDQIILVGPSPDAAYTVEVIGTIRPTPLSSTNTTTYLTLYLPDLFLAASMIFMSGYMRNFGAQADDPKMAASWEAQYQALFSSANVEENRKKYASGAWGSLSPTPIATPTR